MRNSVSIQYLMKTRALSALLLLLVVSSVDPAAARRVKVFSVPEHIGAGQLGTVKFENPQYGEVKSIASCEAEKLIAWVQSEIPIVRIEQNGKQIWTSLGSYRTLGDSVVATFMAPKMLVPGPATFYLVNGRDASAPVKFTVDETPAVELIGVEGNTLIPLAQFRVLGSGFVAAHVVDPSPIEKQLDQNVGYFKLPKADQWTALNHRIDADWDRQPEGNYLYLTQGTTTWRPFVYQCGLGTGALALDFIAPPDIKKGDATLILKVKQAGKFVATSKPITVTVQ